MSILGRGPISSIGFLSRRSAGSPAHVMWRRQVRKAHGATERSRILGRVIQEKRYFKRAGTKTKAG